MPAKSSFRFWLLATLVLAGILNWVSLPLVNQTASWGLFSWQFATTPQRAQVILASWDHRAQLLAAFGLGLDYFFLFVYAVTFNLACRWSAQKLGRETWGGWLGGLVWVAALLDAVENACLAIGIIGAAVSPYPEVAAFSAATKFTLLALALVWILLGVLSTLQQKGRASSLR
ncbi:MAG: hypothetical protein DDG59_15425 [Anaerolineae bacterium]|nr:MAG: hypothetical protein DDG59_15425 [Anaerolineae bacterium]